MRGYDRNVCFLPLKIMKISINHPETDPCTMAHVNSIKITTGTICQIPIAFACGGCEKKQQR